MVIVSAVYAWGSAKQGSVEKETAVLRNENITLREMILADRANFAVYVNTQAIKGAQQDDAIRYLEKELDYNRGINTKTTKLTPGSEDK